MSLPQPEPGLVVRYDYLWSREAAIGREQGKDRPTCLVAASDSGANPRYVVLLPITHSPPMGDVIGIEIPQKVKQAIDWMTSQAGSSFPTTISILGQTLD